MSDTTFHDTNPVLNQFQKEKVVLFSIKELLFKYLSYLPFILLIFSISVGIGYIYIRYTEPVYKASVQILVKTDDSKNAAAGQVDLFQNQIRPTQLVNLDNEILKIKSLNLLKRVVEEGGFNIKVRNIGRFRSSTLYYDSPIDFLVTEVKDSLASFELRFSGFDKNYAYLDSSLQYNGLPSKLAYNTTVNYLGISFKISKRQEIGEFKEPIAFIYSTPIQSARALLGSLNVVPVGKTSILQIELRDDNPVRAKEILNKFAQVFRDQDIENKRLSNINTSLFITERLREVGRDLDSVEARIMELRKSTKLNDIETTLGYYQEKLKYSEDNIDRVELQNEIAKMLEDYFSKQQDGRQVPVDLGIDNAILAAYLRQYNDLQLEYDRQKKLLSGDADRFIEDFKARIEGIRYNILEILKRIQLDNKKRIGSISQKVDGYKDVLLNLPEVERKFKIANAQSIIKKELYLYLLKRKEETEISTATYLSNYEVIDDATASNYPVEPKVSNIRNFSVLIGLIIPIVLIYFMELFNDKVTVREQITKRLKLPIAGEVSHVPNPSKFVFNQSRSMVAEQFRILRTNLNYLFKGDTSKKVILISSTISGEGKSFVSSNLAAALAMMDKKVALLLFDLRKASMPAVLEDMLQGPATKGITNYLIGQTDDFKSLAVCDPMYKTLDIYTSGPIPPNPAELLLSNKMNLLFQQLRETYDFIIVDSAPAGLVSDAFILQENVDITLYIIRQQYTLLKQLDFISELYESEKLKNVSLVVNDVIMGGRYGYYGYNYGYGYAYSYQYGYGYKYTKSTGNYYTDMTESMYRPWWVKVMNIFRRKKA